MTKQFKKKMRVLDFQFEGKRLILVQSRSTTSIYNTI